jgi:hypothetical protein
MTIDPDDNHVRAAEFDRVVDGDTFWANITAIAMGSTALKLHSKVRVHNYNAVELSDPDGPHMRSIFELQLRTAKQIRLRTHTMSYDRLVCDVYLDNVEFGAMLSATLQQRQALRSPLEGQMTTPNQNPNPNQNPSPSNPPNSGSQPPSSPSPSTGNQPPKK